MVNSINAIDASLGVQPIYPTEEMEKNAAQSATVAEPTSCITWL